MKRPTKLALFFLLLVFGLALGYYYSWFGRGISADRLRSLATWGLADFLGKNYPDSRVLVVANPFSQLKGINESVLDQEKSGIDGLRQGFGRGIAQMQVAYPTLKSGARENPESLIANPDVTTPLSYLVETNSFDELDAQHPGHDLWISLIGVPIQWDMVKVWKQPAPPRFALLLPDLKVIGSKSLLLDLVKSEKLVAFVLTKPGVTFDTQELSGSLKEEFERRYLLVTRENIDEVLQKYYDLFVR